MRRPLPAGVGLVVTVSGERHPEQTGGQVVIETRRRWLRLAVYVGIPPGSHIGLWRTRTGTTAESVRGWNLRTGRRYVGPCVTLLAHTRRQPAEAPAGERAR